MTTTLKMAERIQQLLRCPRCRSTLSLTETDLRCTNAACGIQFPVIGGVPILVNEAASLFRIADFVEGRPTTFPASERLIKTIVKLIPSVTLNLDSGRNYVWLAQQFRRLSPTPKVLVIGGSVLGQGMEALLAEGSIELIETDVALGQRTHLVCDAHDIPFEDGAFDGIIAQAVLEHVVDPYRCVDEIHRVLNDMSPINWSSRNVRIR